MATLYDLAMQYLNQSLPKTFEYGKTNPPTIGPVLPVQPGKPIEKLLPRPGGGGDGFSVYNPDPNMTKGKDNYNERPYKSALYNNSFPMMGDPEANIATGALNADGLMSYPGDKPPTGIEKLIGMLPGQQVLKGIKNMLPVNRTGILQNELLGAGFQLNDIGQIVGDPRTVEGVMAGMNTSRMDSGSFDRKSAGIESTLSGKYGLSKSEIDSIKAGNITDAIKDKTFNKTMGTTTNLVQDLLNTQIAKSKFENVIDKTKTVFDAKSLAKDPDYVSFDTELDINNMINKEKEDDENFDPLDPKNTFKNKNAFEINNIVDVQRAKDAIEEARLRDLDAMDPGTVVDNSAPPNNNPNEDHDGDGVPNNVEAAGGSYDGGYQSAEGGFEYTGDFADPYSDDNFMVGDNSEASPTGSIFDSPVTGTTKPGESGGTEAGGGRGTHCCTAANERGDMTLTEVKKLRAWHRKQSKIWQRGYDVWGRVMADNLVSKYKWSSDRVRDFYNHKIYGKRTIGSTFADFCIYPMSMIIGSILTVMPPILGYQENKKHGKSSS